MQDASAAISYARTNKQPLILFALLDGSDQGSRNFATLLNDNKLKMKGEEFVVVLCNSSESKNQSLFAKNFAQKIDVLGEERLIFGLAGAVGSGTERRSSSG